MPQKTRRQKMRAATRPVNVPQVARPGLAPGAPSNDGQAPGPTVAAKPTTQLSFDYTYVYRDLRRIALISVSFFVLLVALSFVLPMLYR
ncbi:MAG TPA: hypothetical protein VIX58_10460 [Anaerolineae bacterium]